MKGHRRSSDAGTGDPDMVPPAEKRLAASMEPSPVIVGEENTSYVTSKGDNASDATSKGDDDMIVGGSELGVEMTDVDEEGFKVVSHRKKRSVGIPVLVSPAKSDQGLSKVNPIVLFSAFKTLLGKAPIRSRFTAQGALLLDVETEKKVNVLLRSDQVGGIAISARLPHSYVQNTCIIKGVPKWYTEEDLLEYLRPQGVLHVRRILRRRDSSVNEWKTTPSDAVVLSFAPNTERPTTINLGFTRHETADYTETPPRCFKCQRFGHVAKSCRGDQRCKRCGGPHDFRKCTAGFTCANCNGDHPASYSGCPFRVSALHRRKAFIEGPKSSPALLTPPDKDSFPALNAQEANNESNTTENPGSVQPPESREPPPRSPHLGAEFKTAEVQRGRERYANVLKERRVHSTETKMADGRNVIRALFAALRSHLASMAPSFLKTFLETMLSLEPVILGLSATLLPEHDVSA